ncbi:MAG: CDP-6-deoxy-delta-3,4-glucoseen reductase [Acidiferrobacterales bacterium]|nr:CDP-6-deoxy-delta-3,4-glucoseen reductase [Acidiferrobacterales bacterium]
MSEFQVRNLSSQRDYTVRPDETILDAILRQGVAVPYSCRNGTCAACKSTLVSGKVAYDPYDKSAMTDAEREAGAILLCRARPIEDLEVRAEEIPTLSNISIQKLPCRVQALNLLAHDVMELTLQLPGEAFFNYIPGQYIDVMMRDQRRRGFSIANPPNGESLTLHVRHVPNGRFTTHIFQSMKSRDILRFEGPLGTFFLRKDSERPVILIAGGTGFAPLNAMIEDALGNGNMRPMHLFWGVRAYRDLYLYETVQAWAEQAPASFRFTPVLSEPMEQDNWTGETGWVHESVLHHYPDLTDYDVYASGPPPMIDVIRETFPDHGLDASHLYYDSFEFSTDTLYPSVSEN